VVDQGSFIGTEGYALHLIPPVFLLQCHKTTP